MAELRRRREFNQAWTSHDAKHAPAVASNDCVGMAVVQFTSDTRRRLVCTEGDAEPHIHVAARRCAREAKGGAADLRNALSPTAAPHNTNSILFISHGIFSA